MIIRSLNEIDLQSIYKHLEKLCANCDKIKSPACKESACLIGFSKRALRFSMEKGVLDIPGANKLIPTRDLKTYYPETVAPGLAETCRQCRQCQDNHSPNCVIALTRTCLEYTTLSQEIDYPGSVFQYLIKVKEQNKTLSELIAAAIKT